MTTSRIVRGTKGRVFLYICAILFVTGLIACYNNVRVQLDETHKSFDLCRKEQENLSTQLQVIYEYKQRLEKSLKTEKGDHQRTKNDLEARINEEKMKNEKNVNDAKLKFSTLQQHYNLLQTQHDDFKEECSKNHHNQLDEINNLQAKLKEVQEQLKTVRNDNENSIKHLKTQNDLLREEKRKLEKAVHNKKSTTETAKRMEKPTTHFFKQVNDGEGHYVLVGSEKSDNNIERPKNQASENKEEDDTKNVIAPPSALGAMKSSSSTPKTQSRSIGRVLPLVQPTATPETHKKVSSTSKEGLLNQERILQAPSHINKKVPEGFVPFSENKKNAMMEDSNDVMNNNVFDTDLTPNELEKMRLKNSFHEGGDDNAKEEIDMPAMQNNNNNNNIGNHIDVLAAAKDEEYDRHGPEEDDDPVDGDNLDRAVPQEIAERN